MDSASTKSRKWLCWLFPGIIILLALARILFPARERSNDLTVTLVCYTNDPDLQNTPGFPALTNCAVFSLANHRRGNLIVVERMVTSEDKDFLDKFSTPDIFTGPLRVSYVPSGSSNTITVPFPQIGKKWRCEIVYRRENFRQRIKRFILNHDKTLPTGFVKWTLEHEFISDLHTNYSDWIEPKSP